MMKKFVDYDRPPINEVVFGAVFERLSNFRTSHFGLFWSEIEKEFPLTEDQLPLISNGQPYDISNPLSRAWFISQDGQRLVQLQQDRLHFNWRKLDETSNEYPSYSVIYPKFKEALSRFHSFVNARKISENIIIESLELSYINVVTDLDILSKFSSLSDALVDHKRDLSYVRFLPKCTDFAFNSVYKLPSESGTLTVEAKTMRKIDDETHRIVQIALTARGIGVGDEFSSVEDWFEMAHEQIVKGFADITDLSLQRDLWGRTE